MVDVGHLIQTCTTHVQTVEVPYKTYNYYSNVQQTFECFTEKLYFIYFLCEFNELMNIKFIQVFP